MIGTVLPLREIPSDVAALCLMHMTPDDPYGRIGEVIYPACYQQYASAFVTIPGAADLTPIDLAFLLAFQSLERFPARRAVYMLRVHMAWRYALRLSFAHEICTARELKTFGKRAHIAKPSLSPQVEAIEAAVRQAFAESGYPMR